MISLHNILKEANESNQAAEQYAKFLEGDVAKKLVPQEFEQNAQTMEILALEAAELVRSNPETILESKYIVEMSKREATDAFVMFYKFMDTTVRNAIKNSNIIKDKEAALKYHDGFLDIVKNIRNYPEILAYWAMALTDVPFYANFK